MDEANNTVPKKNVELLKLNENVPRYGGYCKIVLNKLSKQLIVEPYDEAVKMVSSSFEWNYILEENILFVETPGDISNFALIFKNKDSGNTVFDVATKNKVLNDIDYSTVFIRKCFTPLVTELPNHQLFNIIKKFLHFCDKEKKEIFEKILRENNVGETFASFTAENSSYRATRKRPHSKIGKIEVVPSDEEEGVVERTSLNHQRKFKKRKLQYTSFKIVNYKIADTIRRRLSVFKDEKDQTKCYKFCWNVTKNIFECKNCIRRDKEVLTEKTIIATAVIKENLDGEECVVTDFHKCRMSKYVPWHRGERTIIYKPDYKFVETSVNGMKRQRLIVFDQSNKELCYEYALKSKRDVYDCCGCSELRKGTRAKIFYQNTPDEYLELYCDEHICELRPYKKSSQQPQTQKKLKSSDYEIQNVLFRGKKSKKLIVFDEKDKDFCHELCYEKSRFICRRCLKKKKTVVAYLNKDESGNEYLQLGPVEHVCDLLPYRSEKEKEEIIIDAAQFKLQPSEKKDGYYQIFVFVDSELCYEFSYLSKCYSCIGCRKKDHQCILKICKNDNGEHYIRMKNNQKHVCKPQKFNQATQMSSKSTENFILYQNENGTKKLIVFAETANGSRKYCYDYLLDRTIFKCNKCAKLKKHVSAKFILKKDSNEQYLELGATKHVCKKVEFSSIKICKKLCYEDVFPSKSKKEEQQMITKFELRPNKKNVKDAVLIVLHPTEKLLCYEFHILQSVERYRCINCEKLKSRVSAKLSKDSNGKVCVLMGDKPHICTPIKYEQEISKFTNFIILHDTATTSKVPKLIIFTSEDQTNCYEYRKENLHYVCNGCTGKKSYAKVLKDSDGAEYVDFCASQEHTCTPQLFDRKKYEDNPIIGESNFEIFPNTLKEMDSKLFIFNSKNRQFGYEYYKQKNACEKFYCYQCNRYFNKGVSAKLLKNDTDESYSVKLSKAEHACKIQNFVESEHLYYSPNYMKESDGSKEIITAFCSKDKTLGYKFEYDNDLKIFYCISCQIKNRFISGKIIECGGKECFFVGYDHRCFPRPL